MVQRLKAQRGITIIETTVILSVLFILAGAMSPIVSESVNTARAVKAKNDASLIAIALVNLQKDLGGDALALGAAVAQAQGFRLPEVLASGGSVPDTGDADSVADADVLTASLLVAPGQETSADRRAQRAALRAQRRKWREARNGDLDDHIRTNRRGYRYRRPGEYGGWNGPYVSNEIKGDPWGNRYFVNSQFLDGGASAADANGNPRQAVFVLSAGADGSIDTPFEQSMVDARAFGDDIVIRIQ